MVRSRKTNVFIVHGNMPWSRQNISKLVLFRKIYVMRNTNCYVI